MDKALAKQRKEILFVKIDNDGYNLGAQRTAVKGSQLEEAIALTHEFVASGEIPDSLIAHTVLRTEIAANGDYNLSGERYKANETLHHTSFETEELGNIVEVLDSLRKPITKSDRTEGEYPYYGATGILDYVHEYIFDEKLVLVGEDGAKWESGDKTAFIAEGKYWVNNHAHVLRPIRTKILDLFLVEMLNYMDLSPFITGVTVPKLNQAKLRSIQIPLPPLSIQEEIVAEIESYQKIIDGAKAVVANYKPKIDIDPDWDMVELQEVCESIQIGPFGTQLHKSDYVKNGIPIINPKHIQEGQIIPLESISVEKAKSLPQYFLKSGDIILGRRGEMGRLAYIKDEQNGWFCGTGSLIIRFPKNQNGMFYSYILASNSTIDFLTTNSRGVTMANLNKDIIYRIPVPKIQLETQRQIVAQIEKEQELVNANKQLIEIFEQKIKNRIAKVWGEEKTEEETSNMAAEPVEKYMKN